MKNVSNSNVAALYAMEKEEKFVSCWIVEDVLIPPQPIARYESMSNEPPTVADLAIAIAETPVDGLLIWTILMLFLCPPVGLILLIIWLCINW